MSSKTNTFNANMRCASFWSEKKILKKLERGIFFQRHFIGDGRRGNTGIVVIAGNSSAEVLIVVLYGGVTERNVFSSYLNDNQD